MTNVVAQIAELQGDHQHSTEDFSAQTELQPTLLASTSQKSDVLGFPVAVAASLCTPPRTPNATDETRSSFCGIEEEFPPAEPGISADQNAVDSRPDTAMPSVEDTMGPDGGETGTLADAIVTIHDAASNFPAAIAAKSECAGIAPSMSEVRLVTSFCSTTTARPPRAVLRLAPLLTAPLRSR